MQELSNATLASLPAVVEPPAYGLGKGEFADEVAIGAALRRPLAVLHGRHDQLVSLEYLQSLVIPSLWRGAVQSIDGCGHAPHEEVPEAFAELPAQFIADL